MISLFPYTGGKSIMLPDVIKLYNQVEPDMNTVVEVFGGSAKFLLNINTRTLFSFTDKTIVYNDLDKTIANIWTVLQNNPEELYEKFSFAIYDEDLLNDYKKTEYEGTPIEKAYKTLYLLMTTFNAQRKNPGIKVSNPFTKFDDFVNNMRIIHDIIKHWYIMDRSFEVVIPQYDKKDVFFFLDPPYFNVPYYRINFSDNMFIKLSQILKHIKGKYVMTVSDVPEMYSWFGEPFMKKEYINMVTNTKGEERPKRYELFYSNID